jgi:hypothetical protein
VRSLGIIHRRDRKLSATAQQFIRLLQSQSSPGVSASTNGVATSQSNGHDLRRSRTKSQPVG